MSMLSFFKRDNSKLETQSKAIKQLGGRISEMNKVISRLESEVTYLKTFSPVKPTHEYAKPADAKPSFMRSSEFLRRKGFPLSRSASQLLAQRSSEYCKTSNIEILRDYYIKGNGEKGKVWFNLYPEVVLKKAWNDQKAA